MAVLTKVRKILLLLDGVTLTVCSVWKHQRMYGEWEHSLGLSWVCGVVFYPVKFLLLSHPHRGVYEQFKVRFLGAVLDNSIFFGILRLLY